jgi:hypothetical protein
VAAPPSVRSFASFSEIVETELAMYRLKLFICGITFLYQATARAAPGSQAISGAVTLDAELVSHVSTVDGLKDALKATAVCQS